MVSPDTRYRRDRYHAAVPRVGIGSALSLTSAFFLLGAVLLYTLPDTAGRALED